MIDRTCVDCQRDRTYDWQDWHVKIWYSRNIERHAVVVFVIYNKRLTGQLKETGTFSLSLSMKPDTGKTERTRMRCLWDRTRIRTDHEPWHVRGMRVGWGFSRSYLPSKNNSLHSIGIMIVPQKATGTFLPTAVTNGQEVILRNSPIISKSRRKTKWSSNPLSYRIMADWSPLH